MKLVSVQDLSTIVKQHGFDNFMTDLVNYLKADFVRWNEFYKTPRYASHVDGGVVELMPTSDNKYFAYKYVNGHPKNPFVGKQTVVATGQLSTVEDGYPILLSEMTCLTGFRTAATAIIATDLLARKDSSVLAIIGTGAQSEFQTLAQKLIRNITEVRYFDTDPEAMLKFAKNMQNKGFKLTPCASAEEAVNGADIITVCTACKNHVDVIKNAWVKEGVHINGLGGDCPGKTELELDILFRGKVVVEFTEQSMIEGEIQRLSPEEVTQVKHAELWEIINGTKCGRENDNEVTIFDSVGFALEDYSALRLTHDLAYKYNLGQDIDMIPPITDPKDLISVLN